MSRARKSRARELSPKAHRLIKTLVDAAHWYGYAEDQGSFAAAEQSREEYLKALRAVKQYVKQLEAKS